MMLSSIKSHISARVTQSLKTAHNHESLKSSIVKLLTVEGIHDKEYVDIKLPLKPFSDLVKLNEGSPITWNLSPDPLICKIEKKNAEQDDPHVSFTVTKDTFMKDLFSSSFLESHRKHNPRNIIVEFSSPNIAKPFHMGHLRSTIIGNFVANVKELSENVTRLNYLGDWGTQIGFVKVGINQLNMKSSDIEGDPIRRLYDAYVHANRDATMLDEAKRVFSALESGDPEEVHQWEKIRSLTISHLKKTYKRLGVNFDEYAFESMYSSRNMRPVLEILKRERLLCEQSNGALGVHFEGLTKPIVKSDGGSLYLGRDIAAALDRKKKNNCDMILYVVDKSQSDHLNSLQYILNRITKENFVTHVPFGRVIGMSTRKGTSVFLNDILEKAIDIMSSQQALSPNTRSTSPETTEILAVSALITYILQYKRTRDFHFDWNLALRSTGDTGVKLQYTHSRLISLENKCGVKLPSQIKPEYLSEPLAVQLAVEIARFEEALAVSVHHLESSILINYLFRLCNLVSQCLKFLPIKGQPKDLGEQRLLVFHNSRKIINKAMRILGLQPLQCM